MHMADQELTLVDIYGLWHVPYWQQWWFIPLIVVIGLLVALAGTYVYCRRKAYVHLEPWQQALAHLAGIESLTHDAHNGEIFYVRVTHILKSFLSSYYTHDFMSYTDQQMIDYVGNGQLEDWYQEVLKRIFLGGQMIKFAQGSTVVDQMHQDYQDAVQLIEGLHAQQTLAQVKK